MTETLRLATPILIVGCQRSGTSLLLSMLGRNPLFCAHPDEPQFIHGLYERFGALIRDVPEALAYVTSHPYFPHGIIEDELRSIFDGADRITLKRFVRCYLEAWGKDCQNDSFPILKHPEWIFHLDRMSMLFPDAIVLHIVRDPRSNVLSQRNRWPQFSVWECSMLWKKAVRNARSWAQANPDRYHEIQYENLVRHPEHTLRRFCDAIDIPFSELMLSIDLISTVFTEGEPSKKVQYRATDPSRIELWKYGLSEIDICQIEFVCRKEMTWWGYELTASSVTKIQFVSVFLPAWLQYCVRSIGRSVKTMLRLTGWRLGILDRK